MKLVRKIAWILFCCFPLAFADDFIIDEPGSAPSEPVYTPAPTSAPATAAPRRNSKPSASSAYYPSIGAAQTADTLGQARYQVQFVMVDEGGLVSRVSVGLFQGMDIGIAERVEHLTGSGDIRFTIPAALIKLTLIRDLYGFNWAMGLDHFSYGKSGAILQTNGLYDPLYGVYSAFSWRYSLFGSPDTFTAGIRFPLLPAEARDFTNTSLYASAGLTFWEFFSLGLTVENIYINFTRPQAITPGVHFLFHPMNGMKLGLTLQYEGDTGRINRFFGLDYTSGF